MKSLARLTLVLLMASISLGLPVSWVGAEEQLSIVPDQSVQELPGLTGDLSTPEPIPMCKAGWCSSNEQCEEWYGPGAVCSIGSGQTCGHCEL
jgi:hypothetical protein